MLYDSGDIDVIGIGANTFVVATFDVAATYASDDDDVVTSGDAAVVIRNVALREIPPVASLLLYDTHIYHP